MTVLTYMQIEGEKQGLITGGASTQESIGNLWQEGMEDWTQVLSGEHGMTALFDDWRGNFIKPKERGHQPFQIVKHIDKSSPLLDNALVRGETLKKCCLKLYRYTENGSLENFYTITLYGARVVSIHANMGIDEYNYGGMETERVAFAYSRIAHAHNAAGTSGSCAWNDKAYLLHHTPWTEPERTPEPTVVSKPESSEPEVQKTSYGMTPADYQKFSTPAPESRQTESHSGVLDKVQAGLDVVGLIPGLGVVPDLINAGISEARGDHTGVALAAATAIPFAGDAAGAAKLARDGEKLEKVVEGAAPIRKFGPKPGEPEPNWGNLLKEHGAGDPPEGMINPHAHHIVFKKGRGKLMREYLDQSKSILEKHDIDWYTGRENLDWAPNKNHSTAAAKAVRDALYKADQEEGTREAVIAVLKDMGEHFANDTIKTLY